MLREWSFVRAPVLRESRRMPLLHLGTLDHVFYRLPPGAAAQTREIKNAYGSDHRPLLGRVQLEAN